MRRVFILLLAAAVIPAGLSAGEKSVFDRYFTEGSLRIDLFHTGTRDLDVYAVDEIIREPHWGGNPRNLDDTMNLGGHIYRVFDLATNVLIYSRGYCSLFEEWTTTDEALEGIVRTFHESLIVPMPKAPVQVRIDRRDRENVFHTVYDLVVDPGDYHIAGESRLSDFKIKEILYNGPSESKVDIVILADGYGRDELHKLEKDVDRFVGIFFGIEPFASRKRDFNIRVVESVSAESGVDDPRKEIYRNNLFGLSFNSFDLDRYMLTTSNKAVREAAAEIPYDNIMVLANEKKYGGGGIFNLYATCVSDNEFDGYIFVHEFGHHFAGLADEYYSSEVAYNEMYPEGIEPWEPNITALLDPSAVKWAALVTKGTPIPTPDDSLYFDATGCFEGAGYSAKGLYRSAHDCIMKSKSLDGFCPACRRAIERMIEFQTE